MGFQARLIRVGAAAALFALLLGLPGMLLLVPPFCCWGLCYTLCSAECFELLVMLLLKLLLHPPLFFAAGGSATLFALLSVWDASHAAA